MDDKRSIRIGEDITGLPCVEPLPGACAMIIFGASGNLTRTKLVPALYRLSRYGLLSERFFIIGASRTDMDHVYFRNAMKKNLMDRYDLDEKGWAGFEERLFYIPIDYSDSRSYRGLKRFLEEKEREFGTEGNRLIYLATPPGVYGQIVEKVADSNISQGGGWTRVVIEKPYGRDLESARVLDDTVHRHFNEDQIYRIDHYLGKETVQNIVMLRFANSIFEPLWDRKYIDHVQITVAETIGIENRAGYYEQAGILRDMFQNHLLQILSLIAMEPPSVFESEPVRDERVKVLRALRPLPLDSLSEHLVLGQYEQGRIDGKEVKGYRDEQGVSPDSTTPTFAAMKVYIDNWRWNGVPFYLRSGKRMAVRSTEVSIQFKQVPHLMFEKTLEEKHIGPNVLVLKIQPDERVLLTFHTKIPGSRICLRNVVMDFSYREGYRGVVLDAYERVLLDAMLGDDMLFVRSDGMELSWSFLSPVLELIDRRDGRAPEVEPYRAGTWGPERASRLIQKDGRWWRNY